MIAYGIEAALAAVDFAITAAVLVESILARNEVDDLNDVARDHVCDAIAATVVADVRGGLK